MLHLLHANFSLDQRVDIHDLHSRLFSSLTGTDRQGNDEPRRSLGYQGVRSLGSAPEDR